MLVPWYGKINSVRIYSAALTDDMIWYSYRAGAFDLDFDPGTSPPPPTDSKIAVKEVVPLLRQREMERINGGERLRVAVSQCWNSPLHYTAKPNWKGLTKGHAALRDDILYFYDVGHALTPA